MHMFTVQGMRCGACVGRITQAVRTLDAEARVEADIARACVRVSSSESPSELAYAISAAGYPATAIEGES